MKIVTFCEKADLVLNDKHTLENFDNGSSSDADIVILDINTIFDFEENKSSICKDKFVSIALIDDEEDYDAFKNFGIDSWIKSEDVDQINDLIDVLEKRFLS